MKRKRIILYMAALVSSMASVAQSGADSPATIADRLNAEAVQVVVVQPDALNKLLLADPDGDVIEENANKAGVGYRVQVFSDNNARTAKHEARSKSDNISSRFPQYRTYVSYTSPYWRLRVGDFHSHEAAEEAAAEIRRAFPSYSKEVRVVRDRINQSVQ